MTTITSLKSFLYGLAVLLLPGLFAIASFAEESRPPWKVAVFRTAAPFALEIEQGLKEGLAKLGYVEGQNLSWLPTVIVKSRIEDFAETAGLVKQISDYAQRRGR